MSSHEFETKHELGFLGELTCTVGYFYQRADSRTNTEEGFEIEYIDIPDFPHEDSAGDKLPGIHIDLSQIDDTDLIAECEEHYSRLIVDDRGNEP